MTLIRELSLLRRKLQLRKFTEHRRRVSFGDLISDRWQNAKDYGFGEGSSCYDNVLILGDVRVGKNTWIGPNVILDGSGGVLEIGDFCSVSAGAQIYTHNTVDWATSLGKKSIAQASTRIADGVYIGPGSIISMGISIGSKAVVGAMSFVNKDVPEGARVWGCPAAVVGSGGAQTRLE